MLCGVFLFWLASVVAAAEYPDPERYRSSIVATGGSSMLGWRGPIAGDLVPLTIPRGFGGSN